MLLLQQRHTAILCSGWCPPGNLAPFLKSSFLGKRVISTLFTLSYCNKFCISYKAFHLVIPFVRQLQIWRTAKVNVKLYCDPSSTMECGYSHSFFVFYLPKHTLNIQVRFCKINSYLLTRVTFFQRTRKYTLLYKVWPRFKKLFEHSLIKSY